MTNPELDLTDRMVRAMADRNHTPRERWTVGGTLIFVGCDECGKPWPCPTREALRVLQAQPVDLDPEIWTTTEPVSPRRRRRL